MNPSVEAGAMSANVSLNIRPMVMAGLAKLVELVTKYAAPMYAPTAAGIFDAWKGGIESPLELFADSDAEALIPIKEGG